MLCFAWSLNISHIFALSSRISIFFRFFFQLASFARLFSEEHHVLLHYQNALLRTLQCFEIFLEEHRAFLQVLKQIAVKAISHPNCTLFRFHHSLFTTEYIFFNQHRCHFCHHALNIPSIFHLSNLFSKKIEKKFKFSCFSPQMTYFGVLSRFLSPLSSPDGYTQQAGRIWYLWQAYHLSYFLSYIFCIL